jgi:hypothetical protein
VAVAAAIPDQHADFVAKYCLECHDADSEKGDVNLDVAAIDWTKENLELWEQVMTVVREGDMPPADEKTQPAADERTALANWLDSELTTNSSIGGTRLRRLNRREYQNTVQRMFRHSAFKVPFSFPSDTAGHGFDTMADELVISPAHMEAYRETATMIADDILPPPRKKVGMKRITIEPKEMLISYSSAYVVDGAMRLASAGSVTRNATGTTRFEAPASGEYEIKVTLSTKNLPPGHKPTFGVRAKRGKKGSNPPALKTIPVASEAPKEYTMMVKLLRQDALLFEYPNAVYSYRDAPTFEKWLKEVFTAEPRMAAAWKKVNPSRGGHGWAAVKRAMADPGLKVTVKPGTPAFDKLVKEAAKNNVKAGETLVYRYFENGPNIGIHKVTITGPLKTFADPEMQEQAKRQSLWLKGLTAKSGRKQLETHFRRFLKDVFRRPPTNEQVAEYVDLVIAARRAGSSFSEAMHLSIRTALMSPGFLYKETAEGALDEYELAARLSYFMTGLPPDRSVPAEAVRETATKHLKGPRVDEFAEDFTAQWLGTRTVKTLMPDSRLIKNFRQEYRDAMYHEVGATFQYILQGNRSMREFIDSDYVITRDVVMKDIYKLPIKKLPKNETKKVVIFKGGVRPMPVPADGPRGGLLGMPGLMMATANGVDTQPVLRGVWVLENILGMPPSEPPDAVPALTPDTTGATGPKDHLKKHMADESCARCHRKIDPVGFALENFDPIGRWRVAYPKPNKKKAKPLKVDATGVMPDGTAFKDVRGVKDWLSAHPHHFVQCLCEKLLTYATGRSLSYAERKQVAAIVEKHAANDWPFRDVFLDLIDSDIFRTR